MPIMTRSERRLTDIIEFGRPTEESDDIADTDAQYLTALISYHAPRETSAQRLLAKRDASWDIAIDSDDPWDYV